MESTEAVSAAVGRVVGAGYAGCEVVDRDLVLGTGERFPFVLVGDGGRLVLVLVRGDDGPDVPGAALAGLATSQRFLPAIAEHLSTTRVDPTLPPVLWVVVREASRATRDSLERLAPGQVRLFELVRIESRRGTGEYLTEVQLGSRPPAALPAGSQLNPGARSGPSGLAPEPSIGLGALPTHLRALAHSIARRIEHLDEAVRATRAPESTVWHFDDDVVASLAACGGKLHGSVPDVGFDAPVEHAADVEAFLGAAAERYLHLLGEVELVAAPKLSSREPLLTPEELAHFDPRS